MPATIRPIEVEVGGKRYSGSYVVESGMMHVMYKGARKSMSLEGDSPREVIAPTLLRELIREVEAP
jgi:hypothetical protein